MAVRAARIKAASIASLQAAEAEEGLHRSPRSRFLNEWNSFLPRTLQFQPAQTANSLTREGLAKREH